MIEYQKAIQIVETYMQSISAGDYVAVTNLYADDAKLEDPVGSEVVMGQQAIEAFYKQAVSTKFICKLTGPVRYASQEIVFPFECLVESNGSKMKIAIIDHFVLNDDGLITSMRAFWSQDTISIIE